jgi:hypothetical protein
MQKQQFVISKLTKMEDSKRGYKRLYIEIPKDVRNKITIPKDEPLKITVIIEPILDK